MKVLIVDDEPPARARLRQILADMDDHSCCGEAANGIEALEQCAETGAEVLLLDIRMPGMDGLEVARHLGGLDQPPAVIFTTAYDDFALDAFATNAVHYLVKPVKRDALQEALGRAEQRRGVHDTNAARLSVEQRSHFSVRTGDRLRLVPTGEVLCLRAAQKYVEILTTQHSWLIESSLVSMEQEFGDQFLRVHRNALVRTRAIAGLNRAADGGLRVVLSGLAEPVEVSRRHAAAIRKVLKAREFG